MVLSMVIRSAEYNLGEIEKSSRHQKITGDFGESLVLYWLSKHGYECALIDHTGIDILASKNREVIGISVKTRSRSERTDRIRRKHRVVHRPARLFPRQAGWSLR